MKSNHQRLYNSSFSCSNPRSHLVPYYISITVLSHARTLFLSHARTLDHQRSYNSSFNCLILSIRIRLHQQLIQSRTKICLKKIRDRGRGRARGGGGGRGQGRSFGGGRPTGPPRRGPLAVNARPTGRLFYG
ncbi:unnamed protein product [Lactuca saligna]|uniref:Uncharacterized protein n=1 Tax=Lactuca saligna TaxID=75948 RepID=A0AA36A051_LACSI|nr:unnamed protein product [Lactuca saligna]